MTNATWRSTSGSICHQFCIMNNNLLRKWSKTTTFYTSAIFCIPQSAFRILLVPIDKRVWGRTKKRRDDGTVYAGHPPGPSCVCGCRALAHHVVINPLGARILTGITWLYDCVQARPSMQRMSVIASFQKCLHRGSIRVRTSWWVQRWI